MGAFAAPLVDLGFRVVGFDAPGHAASDGWLSSVPAMARAVREIGERVGPLQAVIAHSLGTTATTLALHAGLSARRCVFLSPPARMDYFTTVFCDAIGFTAEIAARLQRRIENRFDIRFERIAPARLAREIDGPPLLVFHDRDDRDVPVAHGETLVEAWGDARLVRTTGLGHRNILRDPIVIAGAITHVSRDRPVLVGDENGAVFDPDPDAGGVVAETVVVDGRGLAEVVDVVDPADDLGVLAPAVEGHRRDDEKPRGRRRRFLEDIFEGPLGL
jgi:pimeloyl-ACP methyl ester carboxylesterase